MCPKIRCDGESEKFCKFFWELNRALDEMNDMHAWLFKLYITRKLSKSTNYTNYTTSEEQASFFLLDSLFDPKIV
jgi:hypothetical protein